MHLDEGAVQRLLDDELDPAEARAAGTHLADCADCRARVAEARRDSRVVNSALDALDVPPPRIEAGTVAARARAGEPWQLRRAAGFLIAIGIAGAAYAAYAAPGSPVPGWIESAAAWLGGREPVRRAAVAPGAVSGIAIQPGASLVIVFTSVQAVGTARVFLTEGDEVTIRAAQGAATFSSDAERLVIDNAGAGADFTIQLPRTAPRIEIRLGREPLLLKEGGRATVAGVEAPEPWILPLTPPVR